MKLGFIGTGKIASSVILGVCRSKIKFRQIIVSPRNKRIANNLNNPKHKNFLITIANEHSKSGYDIMFDSGYGGEHWLATFAIYNFTR